MSCFLDVNNSSNWLTASNTVVGRPSRLRRVLLTAGSDAATVTLKDGGSGGTTLVVVKAVTNTSQFAEFAIDFKTDIYATLAGTGPGVYVEFE